MKQQRLILRLILILFAALATTYALVVPPFEASDELWHYPLVRHLADGNRLPVQVFDPAQAGPWKQQASQPPLYYYLGAVATFWIDTGDMDAVRRLNPHVDNGVITTDGNVNLAVHPPDEDRSQGTLLAVTVVRLLSVLLGVASVYLTWRLALLIFVDRPLLALGAAALVAFLPMFVFISGAVNSDNLIIPLATLACWLMVEAVVNPQPARRVGRFLLIGVVAGLAALSKIPGVALLALALGTAYIVAWIDADRPVAWRRLLGVGGRAAALFGLAAAPAAAIAGWWYVRNVVLYGDWRGWSAFIAVLGQRAQPASLAQLWDERWGFMLSFWGLFGGVNVPFPTWVYHLLNAVLLAGLAGGLIFAAQRVRAWRAAPPAPVDRADGWWGARPAAWLLGTVEREFGLVVALLWCAAVVVGLIQWATITWSSQGRLVFYALPLLMILLTAGLGAWLPRRAGNLLVGGLALFMLGASAYAPWGIIRPTYTPQLGCATPPDRPVDAVFGDTLRLVGYDLSRATLTPGTSTRVTLTWELLQPTERAWSVFVHLNDPVLATPIAQRDMYPAQGLLTTDMLAAGTCFQNDYLLTVPPAAIAPSALELVVGLYDYDTFERLPLADGGDGLVVADLSLEARPGAYPNATAVNFGDALTLVGYELVPRRAAPGETVALTLYVEAPEQPAADYTFFAQLLEDFGGANRRWAADDVAPAGGTMAWSAGSVEQVTLSLTVEDGAPAGVLPLIIGVYTRTPEGGFVNLPLVDPNGRVTNDTFLNLTPLRIDPAES